MNPTRIRITTEEGAPNRVSITTEAGDALLTTGFTVKAQAGDKRPMLSATVELPLPYIDVEASLDAIALGDGDRANLKLLLETFGDSLYGLVGLEPPQRPANEGTIDIPEDQLAVHRKRRRISLCDQIMKETNLDASTILCVDALVADNGPGWTVCTSVTRNEDTEWLEVILDPDMPSSEMMRWVDEPGLATWTDDPETLIRWLHNAQEGLVLLSKRHRREEPTQDGEPS